MTARTASIHKKLNVFFPKDLSPADTTKKVLEIFGWVKEVEAIEGDRRTFNLYKTYGAFIEASVLNAIVEKGGKMPTFSASVDGERGYTLQAFF